jgi:hypothetical protein
MRLLRHHLQLQISFLRMSPYCGADRCVYSAFRLRSGPVPVVQPCHLPAATNRKSPHLALGQSASRAVIPTPGPRQAIGCCWRVWTRRSRRRRRWCRSSWRRRSTSSGRSSSRRSPSSRSPPSRSTHRSCLKWSAPIPCPALIVAATHFKHLQCPVQSLCWFGLLTSAMKARIVHHLIAPMAVRL